MAVRKTNPTGGERLRKTLDDLKTKRTRNLPGQPK